MGRISFIDRAWKRRAAGEDDGGPLLAYLVRESRTLKDALRRWVAERPFVPGDLRGSKSPEFLEAVSQKGDEAREVLARNSGRTARAVEIQTDTKMSDLFRPEAREILTAKGGLEALAVASAEGSPQSELLEGLLSCAKAAAEVVESSRMVEALGMEAGRPLRAELVEEMVEALGDGEPPDYSAARAVVESWRAEVLKVAEALAPQPPEGKPGYCPPPPAPPELNFVFGETAVTALPLIVAFEDPGRFFREVVPSLFPGEMDLPLPDLLGRWGLGVLLNPATNARFLEAGDRPGASGLLSTAENRPAFNGDGGRIPDAAKADGRNYAALAFAYDALPHSEKKSWRKTEAARFPSISPETLRVRMAAARKGASGPSKG